MLDSFASFPTRCSALAACILFSFVLCFVLFRSLLLFLLVSPSAFRFFLGKNKVMQLALGKTPEEEQKSGLAKLAQTISGTRGLLFTDKSQEEVSEYFGAYRAQHFARSGFQCTGNYKLAAGTLPADRCPHPMEPLLRKVGLPTKLVQGKVELLNDVNVAVKGDTLTPEQCKIMQIFGVKLAQFKLHLLYAWKDGQVSEVEGEGAADADDDADAGEEFQELRDLGGDAEPYVEDEEDAAAGEDDEDME